LYYALFILTIEEYCIQVSKYFNSRGYQGFVSVPEAKVVHPWWNDGRPDVMRFAKWSDGDGVLAEMYPMYAYYNLPNLMETMLLVIFFVLFSGMYRLSTQIALGCCIADALHAIYTFAVAEPEKLIATPIFNVSAILLGIVIRSLSEAGRIVGHCRRFKLFRNLFLRYNWFLDMGSIAENERWMSAIDWSWRIASIGIFIAFAWLI
jgi:hypothetical protein